MCSFNTVASLWDSGAVMNADVKEGLDMNAEHTPVY